MVAYFTKVVVFLAALVLIANARKKADRIYAGRMADIEEFPHQVSIQIDGMHLCGGSIINKYVILTAAHCTPIFDQVHLSLLTVKTGATQAQEGGDVHRIRSWHAHEGYVDSDEIDQHDIALIVLKTPIKFSDKQKPIRLSIETPEPESMAWVSGYGKTENDEGGTSLMAVELPIIPFNKCQKILKKSGGTVTDDMICAGGYSNGAINKDACTGDSGGPLIVNNVQVGVVAWGLGCGGAGLPGVYSNVAYYRKWINSYIKKLLKLRSK